MGKKNYPLVLPVTPRSYGRESGVFTADDQVLFCTAWEDRVSATERLLITQYLSRAKHQKCCTHTVFKFLGRNFGCASTYQVCIKTQSVDEFTDNIGRCVEISKLLYYSLFFYLIKNKMT